MRATPGPVDEGPEGRETHTIQATVEKYRSCSQEKYSDCSAGISIEVHDELQCLLTTEEGDELHFIVDPSKSKAFLQENLYVCGEGKELELKTMDANIGEEVASVDGGCKTAEFDERDCLSVKELKSCPSTDSGCECDDEGVETGGSCGDYSVLGMDSEYKQEVRDERLTSDLGKSVSEETVDLFQFNGAINMCDSSVIKNVIERKPHNCKGISFVINDVDCGNEVIFEEEPLENNVFEEDVAEDTKVEEVNQCEGGYESEPGPSGLNSSINIDFELDEDYRCRSFSLTPTVNFDVFETGSNSDGDLEEVCSEIPHEDAGEPLMQALRMSHPQGLHPTFTATTLCSTASTTSMAICRICHMPAGEGVPGGDTLISPCRCAGTMQYIHSGCLLKWLEITSKRSNRPPCCELCMYQYHRHKKFKVTHWQFPSCSRWDKVLHTTFLISLMVMVACAAITIMCFKQDKGMKKSILDQAELTESEIVTLTCGVLFFLAFFVAMYVEVKARSTIYKLVLKFIYLNQQWYIDEYDKKKDLQPVAV